LTFKINIPKHALDMKHFEDIKPDGDVLTLEEGKELESSPDDQTEKPSNKLKEESEENEKENNDQKFDNGAEQNNDASATNDTNSQTYSSLSTLLSDAQLNERGLFQDTNLYKIFKGDKLPLLWKLWELVITNQPIMIMSDLPNQCRYISCKLNNFVSEAVLGLVSIIYPLEFQGEFKPFFTIYDPDYKSIQELYSKKIVKCAILGVTNPLFLKVNSNYFHNSIGYERLSKHLAFRERLCCSEYQYQIWEESRDVRLNIFVIRSSRLITVDKLYTMPDSTLKPMLIKADSEEADAINNALLRKSLRTLTENFLRTFEDYFKLQVNVGIYSFYIYFKDIKKFEEKDFLKFVELQKFPFKSQFASQEKIIKLYSKFLKSSNFLHYIKTFSNVYFVKNIHK